jgi:hypothetical protein
MDPDVILVGEMRDLETMEAAIRAAETGHLVFATLHTTGAQGTINRIIDAFPVNQQEQIRVQLSTNLLAVLSQTLLPKPARRPRGGYEFLVITPAISNLIRENKTYRIDSAIQTGKKYGMQLLDDHLWSSDRPTWSRPTSASSGPATRPSSRPRSTPSARASRPKARSRPTKRRCSRRRPKANPDRRAIICSDCGAGHVPGHPPDRRASRSIIARRNPGAFVQPASARLEKEIPWAATTSRS